MHIDIFSDPVCPWCLIGKRRLERAIALHPLKDLTVSWRPFQLHPQMPREGADRAEFTAAKFGSKERAQAVYDRVTGVGRAEGIDFRFDLIKRSPNTVDAHRLIFRAGHAGKINGVVEGLFSAFFFEGKDIGNLDVLVDIADAAGMGAAEMRAYLQSDEDRAEIVAADEGARQLGIEGVPFYVIDGKYGVSGAQMPEAFVQIFEQVLAEVSAVADSASPLRE